MDFATCFVGRRHLGALVECALSLSSNFQLSWEMDNKGISFPTFPFQFVVADFPGAREHETTELHTSIYFTKQWGFIDSPCLAALEGEEGKSQQ